MLHNPRLSRAPRKSRRPGFALAETAISVLLVGLLMVAALRSLAASKRREADTVERLLGQQLAGALMNEILLQVYAEPVDAPVFGPEPGESNGNRSLFDDVDDYAGWSSSPPNDRSGVAVPGYTGWTRSATVQWADPITLAATAATKTGLKRVTVTVAKGSRTIATLVGYRSIAWIDTIPTPSDATGNHAPVAVATSPNLTRRVGEAITFDATTSSDQDGDYLSYVWNYGDGTTGTGTTVNKVYNAPGNYSCKLTVYDGRGGTGTSALTAVISP